MFIMKYIFACFCCFILSSCTTIPDKAYHPININPVTNMVIKNGFGAYIDDSDQLNDNKDRIDKTSFNRFYLEYNEDGEKFEGNRQLDIIKRAIDTSDKPVYLFVYVHGWNNNANTDGVKDSFDTAAFPYLLARRSFQNPDMNIIGVYLGWRGAKYRYRPAHFLTPLDRARAADRIGDSDSKEVRNDLVFLANHVEQSTHSGYSLIMGHSFGGRLLSRAFIDDLANTKSVTDWPLGRRSLLVNLNPAIGADAFDRIYSDIPGLGENLQRPLWINLTSEDDDSTKNIFPKARFLLQDLSDKPYSGVNDTIGHHMPYLSHWVTSAGGIVGPNTEKNTRKDLTRCKFESAEEILKDNKPWFEIPSSIEDCATRHLYENKQHGKNDYRYYTTALWPFDWSSAATAKSNLGYMWNFRVDNTLIDHSETEKKPSGNGPHNAFVQTILGRMLDDMLFTPPEKPLN
tara:strand:- start:911 stop:2284 length:1374 start_codon:yes stop_codon:yes gene_type:complete